MDSSEPQSLCAQNGHTLTCALRMHPCFMQANMETLLSSIAGFIQLVVNSQCGTLMASRLPHHVDCILVHVLVPPFLPPLQLCFDETQICSRDPRLVTIKTSSPHCWYLSSPTYMGAAQRQLPNILVTGTPGTGKSTTCEQIAEATGLKYLNVGELVREQDLHCGWDDEYECHIIDEDKVSLCAWVFNRHALIAASTCICICLRTKEHTLECWASRDHSQIQAAVLRFYGRFMACMLKCCEQ